MSKSEKLPSRMLGSSGIAVSSIGLGCMSLSGVYGASSDDDGIAPIRDALDRGISFLDSSDAFGAGHNETLVGKAIKGRRSGVVLATKFGNVGGRGGKFADGRPEFVIASCEASLKRLGVEVIDLYYQHRIDPAVPIEDTVGAMARLVQQGKVHALGLSEASPKTVRRAQAVHPIAAVQNEFSLLYRAEAEESLRTTRELNISFVAENISNNITLVDRFKAIAAKKDCTPGQLALAWLLAQGDDIVPIPGTKHKARLIENIGALSVKLSAADLAEIEKAVPVGAVAGLRYPEAQMKSVY